MTEQDGNSSIEPMSEEAEALFDEIEETPEDVASDLMDLFQYQIDRRLEEWDWTQEDLAEEMGVEPPTVSRLLNGENTTLLSIARVAKALDLEIPLIKLVPEEEVDDQIDEVKSFVRSECTGSVWWPVTRKDSSHLRERMREFLPPHDTDGPSSPTSIPSSYSDQTAPDDYSALLEEGKAS